MPNSSSPSILSASTAAKFLTPPMAQGSRPSVFQRRVLIADFLSDEKQGMFVAQVVGKSMEPAIPDGAYCLFLSPVGGSRHGTYLVQLRDSTDPETGERYTVKRYESEKVTANDGTWRHVKITLKPNNPDFKPILLTCEDEGSVQVIAELLEVVG